MQAKQRARGLFCYTFLLPILSSFLLLIFPSATWAQAGASAVAQANIRPRIISAIDERNLMTLRGNTHPFALRQFDQGAAPPSLAMNRMLMVLQRSADQEAALDTLMEQQQDASSANFHKWLTPEQFGQQFGPADADVQTVTQWLTSHGFQVARVSSGKTVIEFSGTAAQVKEAFHTEIHKFAVNGQDHWANATDPQIPAALALVVAGIDTLNNFPRRAMHEIAGIYSRSRQTGQLVRQGAQTTFPTGCTASGTSACNFGVGPADFAKIYNVPNLLLTPAPTTQFNGTGVTIAVVGDSNINTADVAAFRSLFGLPAPNLNVIVNGPDPGIVPGAETEADLDVQWSGAVAPGATIDFVVSEDTESSLGADLSALYIVDNNLASVLSESFGLCELAIGTSGNQFYNQLWQQAAAQGITVVIANGDNSSAGCDNFDATTFPAPAQFGLQVSGFASTPFDVAVGGTDFNDLANPASFWSLTNTASGTLESALGYIPEMTWNDTCTNSELFSTFTTSTAEQTCNNATVRARFPELVSVIGGSGGKSTCTTSTGNTCSGGYAKPSWQMALTPADGKRDVPDVSVFASNGFNGSFYLLCEADAVSGPSCSPTSLASSIVGVGGTSASAPAFAGIMALVNQATGSRQGNANYILYPLAAQTGATCASAASPASTCVFYDIPAGSTIAVPCAAGSPNCTVTTQGDSFGVLSGFATATGYDLATGLGSVNAGNLISAWTTAQTGLRSSTTALTLNGGTAVNVLHGHSVSVSISVGPSTGGGTPTGSVSLIASNTGGTQGIATFTLNNGSAIGSTNALPGGTYTVFAQYPGDGTFGSSNSTPPISVTVTSENSVMTMAIEVFDPSTGAITNPNASSVRFDAPYLLRINVTSQTGDTCTQAAPGIACPTGTVSVTDNGTSLGGSPFSLNSQGYAEDQFILLTGGAHTLSATYKGDNGFKGGQASDSITITTAPTTTTVSASASTVQQGQSTTFTAQAAPSQMGLPAPTGTMKFLVDSVAQGSGVPMSNGQAQFSAVLSPGTHTVQAQYPGDANYMPSSGSTSANVALLLTATANPATISVPAPGASGSTTISLTSSNGFSGTVTLTPSLCVGLPALSTCSFSASTVNVPVNGTATVMLTVATTAASGALPDARKLQPPSKFNWQLAGEFSAALAGLAVACAPFFFPRRRTIALLLLFSAAASATVAVGCGGGGGGSTPTNPGTPIGTSALTVTITVTGSSQTVLVTVPGLSVTVQ